MQDSYSNPSNTTSQQVNISLSPEEIATRIRDDLTFCAYALIPEETISPYPPFYTEVWNYILFRLNALGAQETFRFALGLPRGHVKTTIIKLLVCYLILHNYDISFILIVCATEPLAENFLEDVSSILSSDIVTQLYGSWQTSLMRDSRKIKTALFNGRSIILAAIGAGTSTRGLNIQNRRPQLIVCDDVQTKDNDDSDTERRKLLNWLVGTLFKARSKTSKTAIIYLGNMYSSECILFQFSNNPHWHSLITGAILADGTALWPELNSLDALIEEYNHDNELGEGATWFAEVQNDPIGVGGGLLDAGEILLPSPATSSFLLDNYPIRWICIDPAGAKKNSDDNVIGCHCLMEEDHIGCFALDNGKYNPEEVILKTLNFCQEYSIPIIFVESNAYQSTLAFWMTKYIKLYNMDYLKVVPMPSGSTSKFQRIKAFVKLFVARKWHLLTKEIHNKVTFQIYSYKLTRQNNVDDIIDEQAMALKALNERRNDIMFAQFHGTALKYKDIPKIQSKNTILDKFRNRGR